MTVERLFSCKDAKRVWTTGGGATRACWSERSKFPGRKTSLGDGLAHFRAKQPSATAIGPSGAFYFSALDARLRRKGLNFHYAANLCELNRAFGWQLPEDGPKTLNGLILERLENIPDPGTSLRVGDYTIEIVQSAGQVVRNARIFPPAPTPLTKHAGVVRADQRET